jgi:hypothetical protein
MSTALAIIGLLLIAMAEATDQFKERECSAGTALASFAGLLLAGAGLLTIGGTP